MRLLVFLEEVGSAAIQAAVGSAAPAIVRPADPAHGDYQLNGVLGLAKQLGRPPRELAEPIAVELRKHPAIAAATVAGPGFINMRVAPAFLAELLLGTLAFVGHAVTRDNHLGDWGTQFGLLIVGMRRHGSQAALAEHPVQELERVYKLVSAEAKGNPAIGDEARAELAKLQKGDPGNRAQWESFIAATRVELDAIYARLDVTFDLWRGESAYEDMLPGVVARLLKDGIARYDQDAVCVFFEDDPELSKSEAPFIVQKKDGAFLYGTTDVATVLWRQEHLGTERAIYVVDKRQGLHFKQLFATVRKLGVTMQLEHVGFGTILGRDGKPLKTRDGTTIRLAALLDEAEERAGALMREEGIELAPELVRTVAVGAVKYADLSQNRNSDYRFDWDKLISLKGNSGPYLQYAHARVRAIFRKGEIEPQALLADGASIELSHDAELLLSKRLLAFADAVHLVAETNQPHLLCEHLYSLARDFSAFYEQCPVLKAEGASRRARLLLCWATARQLARGLGLLGITAPDRM